MLHKVHLGMAAEFERLMREEWKPAQQVRRQKGTITNWVLYRIHFTGPNDEYNYAAVSYHDAWAKTESSDWTELLKLAHQRPNLGPIVSTVVRDHLYNRIDFVGGQPSPPVRYVVMDYMKVKEGMLEEYLKVEREEWKAIHQLLTDEGNRVGWVLWDFVIPGGVGASHDFVTGMLFTGYPQIRAANDQEAFKKAHPGKELQASVARTRKSRDVVKTEVWEVVESLN